MSEQSLVSEKRSNVAALPTVEASQGIAPMVQMVASGQISIEQLDHLMGLQERHEASESRKLYNKAMASFRSGVPAALKDSQGQNGKYASFGAIMNAINGPLGDNGFNVDFKHDQDVEKGLITVHCTITHEAGHSEATSLGVKVEKLGSANAIQSIGGTVSYLKRYTVSSLTGLATEDNDGQSAPQEPVKPPAYAEKKFNENWPHWVERIESGKNTASEIATQLSNGFSLTQEQMAKVMTLSDRTPKQAESKVTGKEAS